jgi:hypothetical protein
MSLGARERHALDSIEHGLAYSDPRLAALLATFARLTSGEDMPARERIETAGWPARLWPRPGQGPVPRRRPAHRVGHRRGWQAMTLVWLVLTVTLATVALAVGHNGKPACKASWAMVCATHAFRHGVPVTTP